MLGIVYGVLNSTVFSAKSVAQSYLTAIADGKYGKANGIADPQVGKNQLKLLSDAWRRPTTPRSPTRISIVSKPSKAWPRST